jgi:hypothetical protein
MNLGQMANAALKGRRPVVLAFTALGVALLLLSSVLHSLPRAWHLLSVPSPTLSFGDLRVITYSVACAHGGGDPYSENGCDAYWAAHPDSHAPPLKIVYNYPPIWLEGWRIDLFPITTNPVGVAFALLAFCAFALIFHPRTAFGGVVTIATVLSPSILVGIERGNSDLLIFSLLVFTLLATAKLSVPLRDTLRAVAIITLTVLKLFPIACVALFARSLKGWGLAILTAFLAATLTVLTGGRRLLDVFHNTPITDFPAFGALPILLGWSRLLRVEADPGRLRMIATSAALVALILAAYVAIRGLGRGSALPLRQENVFTDLAIAGIAVFVLCFMLGSNFDYRLIFLVLSLPLLIERYESDAQLNRLLPLVAIVAFLWLSRVTVRILYLDEVLDWIIFFGAAMELTRFVFSSFQRNPRGDHDERSADLKLAERSAFSAKP